MNYIIKRLLERKDDSLCQESARYIEILLRHIKATSTSPEVLHLLGLDK